MIRLMAVLCFVAATSALLGGCGQNQAGGGSGGGGTVFVPVGGQGQQPLAPLQGLLPRSPGSTPGGSSVQDPAAATSTGQPAGGGPADSGGTGPAAADGSGQTASSAGGESSPNLDGADTGQTGGPALIAPGGADASLPSEHAAFLLGLNGGPQEDSWPPALRAAYQRGAFQRQLQQGASQQGASLPSEQTAFLLGLNGGPQEDSWPPALRAAYQRGAFQRQMQAGAGGTAGADSPAAQPPAPRAQNLGLAYQLGFDGMQPLPDFNQAERGEYIKGRRRRAELNLDG